VTLAGAIAALRRLVPVPFAVGGGETPIVPRSGWTAGLTTLAALAMSFMAVLTLATGLAADRLAESWRADLAGSATVRVIAPKGGMEAAVTSALVVLGTSPGIAGARVLSDAEHRALLEPWLGAGDWLGDLPVPRLIEVRLDGPGPDPQVLQARLDQGAPGAIYDGHAAWRLPLERAAAALRRLAWAATALVALAAAAMVALAARASLAAHADVVRVIRLIGAEDRYISAAFVGRLTARAALGGAAGTLAGAGALALMPELAPGTPMAVSLGPVGAGWALLLLVVPAGTVLVAWLTAHQAVRLMLRGMW